MENSIYKFTNLIYRFTKDADDLKWADQKMDSIITSLGYQFKAVHLTFFFLFGSSFL